MSEQAPERVAPAGRAGSSGGNVFTRKIGPLPMWGWVAIAGGILIAWRVYAAKSSSGQQQAQVTTPSTPADQVPQFVNQTYTTVGAPTPPSTPTGTTPPETAPTPTPPSWSWPGLPIPSPAPPTGPAPVKIFPPPTGLRTTNVGATNVGLQWNTVPSGTTYPGSYTVAVYDSRGHTASQATVSTPDAVGGRGVATVNGLRANTAYHANVWANGGAQAPQHATVSFKTT